MKVVGAAGKGGVCWKETRDGLRSVLRGVGWAPLLETGNSGSKADHWLSVEFVSLSVASSSTRERVEVEALIMAEKSEFVMMN